MAVLFTPKIFCDSVESVGYTETSDGDEWFIKTGETLAHRGQNGYTICQDGLRQRVENTKVARGLYVDDVFVRPEALDAVDNHRRDNNLWDK